MHEENGQGMCIPSGRVRRVQRPFQACFTSYAFAPPISKRNSGRLVQKLKWLSSASSAVWLRSASILFRCDATQCHAMSCEPFLAAPRMATCVCVADLEAARIKSGGASLLRHGGRRGRRMGSRLGRAGLGAKERDGRGRQDQSGRECVDEGAAEAEYIGMQTVRSSGRGWDGGRLIKRAAVLECGEQATLGRGRGCGCAWLGVNAEQALVPVGSKFTGL